MQNNQLSDEQIEKLINETSVLIVVTNNLVTQLTNKDINISINTQKNNREQFVFDYLFIENNIAVLKKYDSVKITQLIVSYNELKKRIENNNLNKFTKNELEAFKKVKLNKELVDTNNEIEKLLNNIQEELGVDKKQMKVVNLEIPSKGILHYVFDFLILIISNLICMFAISGFINWGQWDDVWNLIFFILYYSLIEGLLKTIIMRFFRVYVMKTFGFILVLAVVLSMAITMIFPIFVTINSYFSFILVCILAYSIRKFIVNYFIEKIINSKMIKNKTKENKNGR